MPLNRRLRPLAAALAASLSAAAAATVPSPAHAAAALVPSFNGGISDVTFAAGPARANAIAVQAADGKLVVAGSSGGQFLVTRLDPTSGRLDPSFSGDGRRTIAFASGASASEGAVAVAVRTNGKIVVAGTAARRFRVVQLNADGSPDTTFGTARTGAVTLSFSRLDSAGQRLTGMALRPDGRIVLAGSSDHGADGRRFALAQLLATGRLDRSFGDDGLDVTDITGPDEMPRSITLYRDGRILAAGFATVDNCRRPAYIRYTIDGDTDGSFDRDGRVTTRPGSSCSFDDDDHGGIRSVAVDRGGRLVAVTDFTAHRLLPGGEPDPSFSGDGTSVFPFDASALDGTVAVALDAGGRPVVAVAPPFRQRAFAVGRLTRAGDGDASFGTDGSVSLADGKAAAVAVHRDGRIFVAGSSPSGAMRVAAIRP